MTTKPRPIAVAIISWYFIVTAGISLLFIPSTASSPLFQQSFQALSVSTTTVILLTLISAATNLTCGVAMFLGKRWGRQTYFVAAPLLMVVSMSLYNFKMPLMLIPGILVFGAVVIFLTRPAVNAYFSPQASTIPQAPISTGAQIVSPSLDGKKIASIVLLIPGGFFLMAGFMIAVPLSVSPLALLFMGAIFGTLACAFIIPAVFLWGRRRWAILLGILFMSIAAMLLMMSLVMYQVNSMPEFQSQFAKVDPDFVNQMTRSCLIFGIGSLISGGLLVLLQRVTDQNSKPTETAHEA